MACWAWGCMIIYLEPVLMRCSKSEQLIGAMVQQVTEQLNCVMLVTRIQWSICSLSQLVPQLQGTDQLISTSFRKHLAKFPKEGSCTLPFCQLAEKLWDMT